MRESCSNWANVDILIFVIIRQMRVSLTFTLLVSMSMQIWTEGQRAPTNSGKDDGARRRNIWRFHGHWDRHPVLRGRHHLASLPPTTRLSV